MKNITLEYDFLIVGQGVAGTLLAHFLLKENQKVLVIGKPLPGATSGIAAGLINPITGRRMAKSWRFEELFPFAKNTYRELEGALNVKLWTERNILRALPTVFEVNEWSRRGVWPEHAPYFAEEADLVEYEGKIKPVMSWGEIQGVAKLEMGNLIATYQKLLKDKNAFVEEEFDFSKLEIIEEGVEYKSYSAKRLVFCRGAFDLTNPYFSFLPFAPTKGELLMIRIPGSSFSKILKNHIFIIPESEDVYWVGSTSRFEYEGPKPTAEKKEYLQSELEKILDIPFEFISHRAGIRPTVDDKRPFLGNHPQHAQLSIFNGLGTKGALLAPFFASMFVKNLLYGKAIDKEVDINRFI